MPDSRPIQSYAPAYRRESFGRSHESRRLRVRFVGDPAAPLRILIVAGQHGDERLASAAVKRFTHQARTPGMLSSSVQLALVRNANPDGAKERTRRNAQGIDLNRDHQLLRAAETQALHRFVGHWQPHLVLDVHTYPPRREHLLARNLVHCHDVYLDRPTTPSVTGTRWGRLAGQLLEKLLAQLVHYNYRAARYTLISRRKLVRHSTPDLIDARNSLALRFGIPTLLLEGREPLPQAGHVGRERTRTALQTALALAVAWAEQHTVELTMPPPAGQPGSRVVVNSEYSPASRRCVLAFQEAHSDTIRDVVLPDLYLPEVRATEYAALPAAYAVPTRCRQLLAVLGRHGFPSVPAEPAVPVRVEAPLVRHVTPSARPRRAPLAMHVERQLSERPLDGYLLFPTNHPGGTALAVFLEPESKYGLARYASLKLPLTPNTLYPILRVLQ